MPFYEKNQKRKPPEVAALRMYGVGTDTLEEAPVQADTADLGNQKVRAHASYRFTSLQMCNIALYIIMHYI